jgi:predicted exporter
MKRLAFLGLLLLALVGCFFLKRPTLETSLFALIGEEKMSLSPEILQRGNGEIQVLFFAKTLDEALPVAEAFDAQLPRDAFKNIRFKLDDTLTQDILASYQANPTGLLAPKDAQLLTSGEHDRLRKQAVRKWHTALPPLFPLKEDPFVLLNNFITSRTLSFSEWKAELNGVLTKSTEDGIALLLSLSLTDAIASDPDLLVPVVQQLHHNAATLKSDTVDISLSGVPLHTVEVAGKCKAEITWLSLFSLLVILIIAWKALHSFRAYPYLLFILTLSGCAGALCTLLCCNTIHLLACVFATTLLGLTFDYAFHGLLATDARKVQKNLILSWLTTELSLLPLLFSGIPILFQSAIFMMSGLAAALVAVYVTLTATTSTPAATPPSVATSTQRRLLRHLPLVLFILLLPWLHTLHFETNLQSLHAPSQQLLEAEKRFRDLTFPNIDQSATGILIIEGESIEQVLEREATLNLPKGTTRISDLLPPFEARMKAFHSLQALYATQGDALCQSLGLATLPPLVTPQPWTEKNIPELYLDNFFLRTAEGRYLTLIPNQLPPDALGEGCSYVRPQQMMQQTLDQLEALTLRLLAIVGGVLILLLFIIFKKRAWKIALPSLLAVTVVFLTLGTGTRSLNLFHLLACFMLIGMSIDYTIFFASGERDTLKPITCSFITSLAGFGALALVSFMVIRSIGQVFAIGLTVSYCSAYLLFYKTTQKPQTEKAATVLGMTLLLWGYRLFGKGFLDGMGQLIA